MPPLGSSSDPQATWQTVKLRTKLVITTIAVNFFRQPIMREIVRPRAMNIQAEIKIWISLSHSTSGLVCAREQSRMKRLTLIFATLAIAIAPLRLPAQSCVLSNVVSEQACAPGSCANKKCCRDAKKNTASAAQTMAKADATSQLIAPLPAKAALVLPSPRAKQQFAYAKRTMGSHSPPRLALLCTFLI